MDEKQALDILNQGINVGLGAGAFKNSKDVAIVSQAIEVLAKFLQANESRPKAYAELVEDVPTKKSK
jgi:hypothetical protein